MARATHADDILLEDFLEMIESGTLGLPNFQRDFDWTDEDVKSLLGTVLSGWPIGSLLLIEVTEASKEFFQPRPFETAPPLLSAVEFVALDGQQRLTSLYQALAGKGRSIFAIRADADINDIDDLDAAIVSVPVSTWDSKYSTCKSQWDSQLIPLKVLRTAADFYAWRDEAARDDQQVIRLTRLYRTVLSGLHSYRIPSVVVSRSTPPQAVARIFERVNRTGRNLGAFDLVVARSFTENFNLRKEWETALEKYPKIRDFQKDDGLPILSAIALRVSEDVRQSAVLNLKAGAIHDSWAEGVKHYNAAISYLNSHLGVLRSEWLPYRQILTVLTALDFERPLAEISHEIDAWFWQTAIEQRYWAASNTRSVADYKALLVGRNPSTSPLHLVREELRQSTRQQEGALHKAFLCLLGEIASQSNETGVALAGMFDHSLFPRSQDADPPWHLRTLGFVLSFADNGPSDLQGQLLPPGFRNMDPLSVIDTRIDLLSEHIRNHWGIDCDISDIYE